MYKLKISRREKKKLLRAKWLILFLVVMGVGLIVWLAWIRPMQQGSSVKSFDECAAAGYPIQESYPEVCATDDGKRFVNPKQQAAHQSALDGTQELLPPTNPALLKLDVDEWDVSIPLTRETFDLTYAYFEDGGEEYLYFTYKRLIQLGVCQGDIGLKVTRLFVKNEAPFTKTRPAPIGSANKAYFYPFHHGEPCYDLKNPEQTALIKEIAGDKDLLKVTEDLVSKIRHAPELEQ